MEANVLRDAASHLSLPSKEFVVLVEAVPGGIRMTSRERQDSVGAVALTLSETDVKVPKGMAVVLSGVQFCGVLGVLPDGDARFVVERETLTLVCGSSRFALPVSTEQPPVAIPEVPEDATRATIAAVDLAVLRKRAITPAREDDPSQAVGLYLGDGLLKVFHSDRIALLLRRFPAANIDGPARETVLNAVLALGVFANAAKAAGDVEVAISASGDVWVMWDGVVAQMLHVVVTGVPSMERVEGLKAAKPPRFALTFPVEMLEAELERALVTAPPAVYNGKPTAARTRVIVGNDRVEIVRRSENGTYVNVLTMPVKKDSGDISFDVDAKVLRRVMGAFTGDVTMGCGGAGTPVFVGNAQGDAAVMALIEEPKNEAA